MRVPKAGVVVVMAVVLAGALFRPGRPARAYQETAPEPTASYASLESARDSIAAIIARVFHSIAGPRAKGAPPDTMITLTSAPARFRYWYAGDSAAGWMFRILVRDTTECPMMKIEYALDAAGWAPNHAYMADGPDGSVVGFISKGQFCMVEGQWDGGDDSDTTAVITPGCEVTVTCVPRRPDDVPR